MFIDEVYIGYYNDGRYTTIKRLDIDDVRKTLQALEMIAKYSTEIRPYVILESNYWDLIIFAKQFRESYFESPFTYDQNIDETFDIANKCVLNFLSSMRTYLDHSETILKRSYGKDSEQVKQFKTNCSKIYDTYPSYRFLYKLRNFAQHCVLPITTIVVKHTKVEGTTNNFTSDISINISRDKLLTEFKEWGEQVKNEIQAYPSSIDIIPPASEVMACIEMINRDLFDNAVMVLKYMTNYIVDMFSEDNFSKGYPCMYMLVSGDHSSPANVKWFPKKTMMKIIDTKCSNVIKIKGDD